VTAQAGYGYQIFGSKIPQEALFDLAALDNDQGKPQDW